MSPTLRADKIQMGIRLCGCIGEFQPQTDQRSDDSNLQHVKGETGRNHYKAVS